MMIDIKKIFDDLQPQDSFKKIKLDESPISVFCGLRELNKPSIAFMTTNPPLLIESTQCIKVTQWEERTSVYWSSFDLQALNARTIFYALCIDLLQATAGTKTDDEALCAVKNRYTMWRKMFKKMTSQMSIEEYQGLFGELYFIWCYLSPKIGTENAIKAWSGANRTAKDFSFDEDWYEIKTITTNATEIKISSATQLESDVTGRLMCVRVERMSEEYSDGHSSVDELISLILQNIDDTAIVDLFLHKIASYGYSAEMDLSMFPRFRVSSVNAYLVNNEFPRITSKDISFDEITKVTYSISINGIERFKEV